jgi:hypothetical protein
VWSLSALRGKCRLCSRSGRNCLILIQFHFGSAYNQLFQDETALLICLLQILFAGFRQGTVEMHEG